jgi:cytochrome b
MVAHRSLLTDHRNRPLMTIEVELPATRVWDLPTRAFHWTLALVTVLLVITGHVGGNALDWHMRMGYLVFTLLLFRLLWGFVGGRWSRFASFVHAPGTVMRYLRGQAATGERLDIGHNPLGGLSVLALLALLAVQVATGLVADDEVATTGPLNSLVSNATAGKATGWHTETGQWLLIGLVLLHIGAILFHRFHHGADLVRPMLTGDKALPTGTPASVDNLPSRGLALLLAAASAGVVAWVVALGR